MVVVINKLLNFGEDYPVTNTEEKNNMIIIHIKSKTDHGKCPNCGIESYEYHATYSRMIQDTPIHNTETWLKVNAYEYRCNNPECFIKTFNESLPFARKNKVMTDNLVRFILSVSIFMSSSSTSLILSFMGVKVSADTIDNIIHNIKIIDRPDVEEVGIDDVAIRKGVSYATAIYDLKDHSLLALLEGREARTLEEWLKEHPKIRKVARDRASAYAKAISNILPNCIQIADRFHLFENLIEHLKDIFYKGIPEKIFIKDGKILDEKINKVPEYLSDINQELLSTFDYDNTPLLDENGKIIEFDNRLHNLDSKQYVEQAQNRKEKQEMIIKLRERLSRSNCHETQKIAKEFGISIKSLRKYKNMSEEEVEEISNRRSYKKGKTKMDDYMNIIFKMLKDGISQEYIMAYVLAKGCKASLRYLKNYINLVAKNNGMEYKKESIFIKTTYPKGIVVITRLELLKYILTLDKKKLKNETIEQNIEIIIEKYPIVKDVQNIFKDFHDVIFGANPEKLDLFIRKYEDKINTFCNGLKKDIAPVKNAISNSINSGFVEGNNNKFKLIKRIVYGKQKIVNLFKKSFLAFLATLDDFSIDEIVNSILDS